MPQRLRDNGALAVVVAVTVVLLTSHLLMSNTVAVLKSRVMEIERRQIPPPEQLAFNQNMKEKMQDVEEKCQQVLIRFHAYLLKLRPELPSPYGAPVE